MTQNEKEKTQPQEEDNFELPSQVTVYSDPNANVCEGCQ
jgi:hypothetical protein